MEEREQTLGAQILEKRERFPGPAKGSKEEKPVSLRDRRERPMRARECPWVTLLSVAVWMNCGLWQRSGP